MAVKWFSTFKGKVIIKIHLTFITLVPKFELHFSDI